MATSKVENDATETRKEEENEDFEEGEEEEQLWEDWNGGEGDDSDEQYMNSEMLCLFCDSLFSSSNLLFEHCADVHHFDFDALKKAFNLDFYGCFKLLNYIRFKVRIF